MMVVTHAFLGAAGGEIVRNPILAFVLGVVIHLLVDKIPHLLPEDKKARFQNQTLDGVLTIMSLVYIYFLADKNGQLALLTGALGGVSVDVLLVLTPLYFSKLGQWHTKRQYHKENYWFLGTDIGLIVLSLIFLLK